MTIEATKKFLEALNTAGVDRYQFDTDLGTHLYNDDKSIILIDDENETAYNFCQTRQNTGFKDPIQVFGAHLSDIHEVRFAGNLEQIKKFVDAYGLSITDDQVKILVNIDNANYNLKPVTGDYRSSENNFTVLSEEELAALSEEEKTKYKKDLKAYNASLLPKGSAAMVN